jgi:hypothetical protein
MSVRFRTIWFCDEADGGRLSESTRERSSRRDEVEVSRWERVAREGVEDILMKVGRAWAWAWAW